MQRAGVVADRQIAAGQQHQAVAQAARGDLQPRRGRARGEGSGQGGLVGAGQDQHLQAARGQPLGQGGVARGGPELGRIGAGGQQRDAAGVAVPEGLGALGRREGQARGRRLPGLAGQGEQRALEDLGHRLPVQLRVGAGAGRMQRHRVGQRQAEAAPAGIQAQAVARRHRPGQQDLQQVDLQQHQQVAPVQVQPAPAAQGRPGAAPARARLRDHAVEAGLALQQRHGGRPAEKPKLGLWKILPQPLDHGSGRDHVAQPAEADHQHAARCEVRLRSRARRGEAPEQPQQCAAGAAAQAFAEPSHAAASSRSSTAATSASGVMPRMQRLASRRQTSRRQSKQSVRL